jgi:hypothetical protein
MGISGTCKIPKPGIHNSGSSYKLFQAGILDYKKLKESAPKPSRYPVYFPPANITLVFDGTDHVYLDKITCGDGKSYVTISGELDLFHAKALRISEIADSCCPHFSSTLPSVNPSTSIEKPFVISEERNGSKLTCNWSDGSSLEYFDYPQQRSSTGSVSDSFCLFKTSKRENIMFRLFRRPPFLPSKNDCALIYDFLLENQVFSD